MGRQMDTEGFSDWLRSDERSENTVRSYLTAVNEYFGRYQEITKANMISHKKWLIEKYSPSTADLRCIAMNRYCHYVKKPDCCVKTIRRNRSISTENVISLEEYQHLIDCLKRDGDMTGYRMVLLMAKTGARVSELVRMKKDCLDKGYMELWTKGRIRRIYIPKSIIPDLEQAEGEYLITNKFGERITREGVRERLQRYAKRYGIRKEVMHPHSFRHLYAIQFLKHDNDLSLLADLMGHAEISTTARYTQLTAAQQADRLNRQAEEW